MYSYRNFGQILRFYKKIFINQNQRKNIHDTGLNKIRNIGVIARKFIFNQININLEDSFV